MKTTHISYRLTEKSKVEVSLFDVLGNKIKTVVSTQQIQGNYTCPISMEGLSEGIYFVKIQINNESKTLKVALRK